MLISVILPIYNAEDYLEEAIKSLLHQTYTRIEVIAVNDASTDNSPNILENFNDERLKVIHLRKNMGIGWVMQHGLNLARGSWVARLDADDILMPQKLEKQINFINRHPEVAVVYTFVELFSYDAKVRKSTFYKNKKLFGEKRYNQARTPAEVHECIYWDQCFCPASAIIKKNIAQAIGYDPCFRSAADYTFFYNLNKEKYVIDGIPEVLYRYRIVPNSSSDAAHEFILKLIYKIKKQEIDNLFADGSQVYIWGTGTQAKILKKLLKMNHHTITGFIENKNQFRTSIKYDLPVISPHNLLKEKCKIIVAAQPVREKCVSILKAAGKKMLRDYMVFF